ncbi:MAG: restriction endonuclease subunit S [Gemmatimonadetes bacterium]|nr:restriction endonuclease subunit S [Gemmatimonadota bacterium]MCY3944581.1 restriction endonuclease subunit S [Gemmatimonadota bacterium]
MRGLPEGWVWTTLGECFDWGSGGTPRKSVAAYYGGGIPWAVIGDLNDDHVETTRSSISLAGLENSSAKWVDQGSVLLAMYGSIGKLGIASRPLTTNQAIAHAHPEPVPSRYLFWYLRRIRSTLTRRGKGGTQQNISQTVIKAIRFPLAPLPEQRRIVAKIESLFAKLDDAVAALKRAEANLERYRASVLKAAVEGRLTERWRRENPPEETGEELLERILVERRKRWEAEQLAKFEAKGKRPPKDWKSKYKEPVEPDTDGLPGLPEGWCWATVGQLAASMANGIYKPAKFYSASGIPCLRMYNIVNGELVLRDLKRMVLSEDEMNRYGLKSGDLLINRVNSRELVGKAAAIPDRLGSIVFESKNIRLRPVGMGYETRFLAYCFAVLAPAYFGRHSQQVVGMASISQKQIGSLVVPVPPSVEQRRIVTEVDRRKRSSAHLGDTIKAKRRQSRALRHSILERAFEGRLVPQAPTDEPASALLERIRVSASRRSGHNL